MIKSGKKETVWGYLTFIISSGAMYLLWRNFTVGFSAGAGAIDGITGSAIGELFIKVIIGGVTYLAIIGAIFAAVKGVIVLKENINYRNTRGDCPKTIDSLR